MIYINVTNTFTTRLWTGIQRVVREVCRHLLDLRNDVELVVFDAHGMQALNDAAQRTAFLQGRKAQASHTIALSALQRGDVLLEMDSNWSDTVDYATVLSALKQRGVIIVKLHHDAVPLLHPQFSHPNTTYRFSEDFLLACRYADHWICTTAVVKADLRRLFALLDEGEPAISVVALGAEPGAKLSTGATAQPVVAKAPEGRLRVVCGRPLVLAVGTVEPRKNHQLLLDSFDHLRAHHQDTLKETPCVVIVGKSGWRNEAIAQRIRSHPAHGKDLFWFEGVDDAELAQLYAHAWLCACLSHYEGYGLPAVEALQQGVAVCCLAGTALEEVSQGLAEVVAPEPAAVSAAWLKYLQRDTPLRVRGFMPVSWRDTAHGVSQVIDTRGLEAAALDAPLRQAVFISIRPERLQRAVRSIAAQMPFIREVIVLTSDRCFAAIERALEPLQGDHGLKTLILHESALGLSTLPQDHAERNMLLRARLYQHEAIDHNFIAFDDDYVVIEPLGPEVFVNKGRHQAYYFHEDGRQWLGGSPQPSSYDRCVWRTVSYLAEAGYATRLYSAHQPQIINKVLAAQIFRRTAGQGLDEWSSYFNIARHLRPQDFIDCPYVSAGWSGDLRAWVSPVLPECCLFYNDPPGDADAATLRLAAERWREQAQRAQQAEAAMQARAPILHIGDGEAHFMPAQVSAGELKALKIPILSTHLFTALSWEFDHHGSDQDGNFTFASLPAFIHLRLPPAIRQGHRSSLTARVQHLDGRHSTAQLLISA